MRFEVVERTDNNLEKQQEERKTDFETDFGGKKEFGLDGLNSPAMKVISENYEKNNPAKTLDNVINAVTGATLNSLNPEEMTRFEEMKAEFISELETDADGKLTPEAIMEMAENIADLTDFVGAVNGAKGKQSQDQSKLMQENIERGNKATQEFVEKMKQFINEAQERKNEEVQKAKNQAETARIEGDKEAKQSVESAEKSLDNWPA